MKKKIIIIIIIPIVLVIGLLVYNYIYVNNYNFKLKGSDTILLNVSDTWEDPLYIVDNNKNVVVKSNVNYNQEGDYQITYTLKIGLFSKTLTRFISIFNDNQTTSFIINLKGDNPYYLMLNHDYIEEGYEVYDITDGYLTNNVTESNNINNTTEGKYEVKYQIKNSNNITKTFTREVIVYSFNIEKKILNTDDYAKENTIILDITDKNYSYTILPDGNKNDSRTINYKVIENNTYTFTIYDINNDSFEYKINITNIDREKPTGKCVLTLKNNSDKEINVEASDNNKIKGYVYEYGGYKTNLLTQNNYTYKSGNKTASVTIYDMADNSETIECEVSDKIVVITPKPTSTPTPKPKPKPSNNNDVSINYATRSYTTQTLNGVSYALYSPSSSINGKIPLVIYYHGGAGLNIGLPAYIAGGANYPFYVAFPINNQDPNFATNLISNLSSRLSIDTKRVYVAGASSGTKPAMVTAYQNQGRFAGVIILASYSGTPTLNAGVPMWFFQGTNDSYQMVVNIVNNINASGGKATLTAYNGGGHDSPLVAFNRGDLINWILKK